MTKRRLSKEEKRSLAARIRMGETIPGEDVKPLWIRANHSVDESVWFDILDHSAVFFRDRSSCLKSRSGKEIPNATFDPEDADPDTIGPTILAWLEG